MAYQALYRAWRPEKFSDIYGQEAVTRTLKKQIETGHISHAYLFAGSRGTGKTTTAKVMARALNCLNLQDGEPCGECEVCRQLKSESCLDVLEIDAASNNGVDEVRLLRERIAYPPTVGKWKVYIIDEVHMLSKSAFNALLKTLEEPPSYAVFILATTEPEKLLATVVSRCLRFDFRRIGIKDIVARMNVVLEGIGRTAQPEALEEIAAAADGGMRDALSLLDMCLSYTEDQVTAELVRGVLGSNGREFMFRFVDCLEKGDASGALTMINEAMLDGRDPEVFAQETAEHMRTLLIAQMTGMQVENIAELTGDAAKRFVEQGNRFESTRLMRAMDLFVRARGDMRSSFMPRSVLDMCAVKASRVSREKTVEGLSERVEALEKQLREGNIVPRAPEPAPEAPARKESAPALKPAMQVPQPDADGGKPMDEDQKRCLAAIQEYSAKTPQIRLFLTAARYVKTEDDAVYINLPQDSRVHKTLIENKASEIEEYLAKHFGRKMRLVVGLDESRRPSPSGISGRTLAQTFDVFGRDKVELVD